MRVLDQFWLALHSGQLPQMGGWDYILLAVLVAIEGPIATLLGAAAASAGLMRPGLVFVSAAGGNLAADLIWYSLGYAGRIDWILRYGRWLGVRQHHLERLQAEVRAHAVKILFFAKLTAGFVIPSLLAAGLVRAPWKRWFPAFFAAETLWTGSLVIIGFFATQALKQVEKGVEYVGIALSISFLLVILWWLRRVIRKKEEAITGLEEENHSP